MKKLLFVALLACGFVMVQAQSESLAKASNSSVAQDAATVAASMDPSIDRRVCETSGKVSYYKKDVCEKSGKVSFSQVQYDAASGQFVNVSPSQVAEKAVCAGKTSGKSCCASKSSSASATAGTDEKANCAGKASDKACCSKKAKSASAAAVSPEGNTVAPSAKKTSN